MTLFAAVLAGLFGLVIGSFLNVVVARVPAHESLLPSSHCRTCGSAVRARHNVPVVSWLALRGRCHDCAASISPRYPLVEAGTGLAFAAIAVWSGAIDSGDGAGRWLLAAGLCAFAATSIALALIDLATHRLPDAIVGPAYPMIAVLLAAVSASTGDWADLVRGAGGMVLLALGYGLIHSVRPDGLGLGDVKLAGLIGLVTGYVGWSAFTVGAAAAFLLAGSYGAALVVSGRAGRRSGLAFGPWMLAGGWVGLAVGAPLAAGYLQIAGLA